MIETVLTVPNRDNNGRPFRKSLWTELERQLAGLAGGVTMTQDHQGVWEHEGTIYRDVSRRYEVALKSWMDMPANLDIVRWVREAFDQLAVYYKVAGIPEVWPP